MNRTLADKLAIMEKAIGKRVIDAMVLGPSADIRGVRGSLDRARAAGSR